MLAATRYQKWMFTYFLKVIFFWGGGGESNSSAHELLRTGLIKMLAISEVQPEGDSALSPAGAAMHQVSNSSPLPFGAATAMRRWASACAWPPLPQMTPTARIETLLACRVVPLAFLLCCFSPGYRVELFEQLKCLLLKSCTG